MYSILNVDVNDTQDDYILSPELSWIGPNTSRVKQNLEVKLEQQERWSRRY